MLEGHICLTKQQAAAGLSLSESAVADAFRAAGATPVGVAIARDGRVATAKFNADGAAGLPRRVSLSADVSVFVFYRQAAAAPVTPDRAQETQRRETLGAHRIFVVGAGGIGCELLKCLVLAGAAKVVVIDLDTIDSTNLNRQFLFNNSHVGRPKALVAAEVVTSWRRGKVSVEAIEGNVKDARFDVAWYEGFDIVINGLDNVGARKHVNRMCVQAGVPLVESGTMGYNGQVQPIVRDVVECYDCRPKAVEQKTFAVCTIHARPTTFVHCVHYAKEVYARLFGDQLSAGGGDGQKSELDFLSAEMMFAKDVAVAVAAMYDTLFVEKVQEALKLKSDWTIRPPVPLTPASELAPTIAGLNGLDTNDSDITPAKALRQLQQSVAALAPRGRRSFTKDDDDMVAFVAAVANLRALVFHIAPESTHKAKTIAGNIVPAIASTNAVIASCAVHAACCILEAKARGKAIGSQDVVVLRHAVQTRRRVVVRASGEKIRVRDGLLLHSFAAPTPNPACLVCSPNQRHAVVSCNAALHTLGSLVQRLLIRDMGLACPTVDVGSSTLYEHEEFEDLAGRPLTTWLPAVRGGNVAMSIGDLNQSIEWTLQLQHDFSLDETAFVVAAGSFAAAPGKAASTDATQDAPADASASAAAVVDSDDDAVVAFHPAKRNRSEDRGDHGDAIDVDADE